MAKIGRPATGRKDRYAGRHVTFVDNSDDVLKSLKTQANAALREMGVVYAEALAEAAPKHSGALSQAAGYRLRPQKGTPRLEVGFFTKNYGLKKRNLRSYFANPAWLEFGTKPHVLVAGSRSGKRALANNNAAVLYGRKVRHPGQQAKPFIKSTVMANVSAARAAAAEQLAILSKSLEKILDRPENNSPYDATSPQDRAALRSWIDEQNRG